MLTLDEDLYFKIRKAAERDHIPVATYIKVYLAQMVIGGDGIDGK